LPPPTKQRQLDALEELVLQLNLPNAAERVMEADETIAQASPLKLPASVSPIPANNSANQPASANIILVAASNNQKQQSSEPSNVLYTSVQCYSLGHQLPGTSEPIRKQHTKPKIIQELPFRIISLYCPMLGCGERCSSEEELHHHRLSVHGMPAHRCLVANCFWSSDSM